MSEVFPSYCSAKVLGLLFYSGTYLLFLDFVSTSFVLQGFLRLLLCPCCLSRMGHQKGTPQVLSRAG